MEEYVKSMFQAPIPAKTKKNTKLTNKQETMISTSPIEHSTIGLIISKTIVIRITCLDTQS